MSSGWIGGVLGLALLSGVTLIVRATPWMRRPTLVDRLSPYLVDAQAPHRLLDSPADESFVVARRLLGPLASDAARAVDRVVGGAASVRRRLGGLGLDSSVEAFRLEQVIWGVVGAVAGAFGIGAIGVLQGRIDVVLVLAGALIGVICGVLGRDWALRRALERHEAEIMAEFPLVADLLALAVTAGEAPLGALTRVCALTRGALSAELARMLARAKAGEPITRALRELADRTTVEALTRFLEGLITAIERGTPLADVLRAQAGDVRELAKRQLLESAGRKEIGMLVPVVFLIMPITVIFALYPGLATFVSVAG